MMNLQNLTIQSVKRHIKRLDFSKNENDISISTTKRNLQNKSVNVSHGKTRNVVEKLKGKNKFLEIDNSVKNQSPLFRVNRHENDDNVTNISTPKSKKVSVSFINSEKNKPSEVDNLRNSQTPLKKIDFNTKKSYDRSTSSSKKNLQDETVNISHGKIRNVEVSNTNLEENNQLLESDDLRKTQTPSKKLEFTTEKKDSTSTIKKFLPVKSINMSNVKTRKFSKIPIRILEGNNKSLAARISTKNQTMHNEFETSSDENYYKSTSPTKRNSRGKSINISHGKRKISDVPITDLEEENELLEVENTRKDQAPHQKSVNISSVKTRKVSGVPITNLEEENELLEFENSRKDHTPHQKSTPTKGILKRKSINISSVKTRKVSGVPITNLEEENEPLEFEISRKDQTPHQNSTPTTKGTLKRKIH
ncbi:hypothetical protein CEXT_484941 [Caerostris extrusa]|uniref:Uncharacterized protein n=1 Tax=Caerostris extrusa TaxID=172846 RepID=A0AAV4SIG8_CAEEX|nr:hypothetical protein CEXT_484941 [Caerostris extrusa]